MGNDVRFIRKNGKIIPLRIKKSGNVDKRHVTNTNVAEYAAKRKTNKKGAAVGALALGGLMAVASRRAGFTIAGAAMGALAGGISHSFATKEKVANSLKKHVLKKKKAK